jgi:hypothetical protein
MGREDREFSAIDAHALAAPASAAGSIPALAAYLIEPARDDRERARAVFRWIVGNIAYDPALRDQTPSAAAVLKRRRGVCSGYAALFKALAEAAGLEAEVIRGHSKGAGYRPGRRPDAASDHAWNAVRIKGKWGLVDCTWAAGSLDDAGRLVPHFTDHYFLTPPDIFADDHFPDDPRWQLLSPPMPREEYLRRVQRRPAFFEHGLHSLSTDSVRIATDRSASLTIGAPEHTMVTACLFRDGRELDTRYTFAQREADGYAIRALLPGKGEYLLRIYAADKSLPDGGLDWALAYEIKATRGSGGKQFPKAYGAFLVHDCRLDTPLAGILPARATVSFSMAVPGAQDVVVMTDGAAERLACQGGSLFAGAVRVAEGEVTVLARFADGRRYEGLLGYIAR